MNSRHHDHSRRVIITIGFAATLLAAVTGQHDDQRARHAQPSAVVVAVH